MNCRLTRLIQIKICLLISSGVPAASQRRNTPASRNTGSLRLPPVPGPTSADAAGTSTEAGGSSTAHSSTAHSSGCIHIHKRSPTSETRALPASSPEPTTVRVVVRDVTEPARFYGQHHQVSQSLYAEVERPPARMRNHCPSLASRASPSVGCQGPGGRDKGEMVVRLDGGPETPLQQASADSDERAIQPSDNSSLTGRESCFLPPSVQMMLVNPTEQGPAKLPTPQPIS
ncbi:hypothetical protein PAMA_012234 [Pampus argenteus]